MSTRIDNSGRTKLSDDDSTPVFGGGFMAGNRSTLVVVLLLVVSLAFVMGDVLLDSGNLPGTDTYWHVSLIDEAMDRFRAGQPIGPIAESVDAGRSYLYDTDSSYPQFGYWVAIVVGLIVGNSALAFAILMFAALLAAQLTFFLGFRDRFGVLPAAYGAVAFGYAPFLMTNVLPQGRFPAVLAVSLLPLIMSALLRTLDTPHKKWWIADTFELKGEGRVEFAETKIDVE